MPALLWVGFHMATKVNEHREVNDKWYGNEIKLGVERWKSHNWKSMHLSQPFRGQRSGSCKSQALQRERLTVQALQESSDDWGDLGEGS